MDGSLHLLLIEISVSGSFQQVTLDFNKKLIEALQSAGVSRA